jgi:hypothetical protein
MPAMLKPASAAVDTPAISMDIRAEPANPSMFPAIKFSRTLTVIGTRIKETPRDGILAAPFLFSSELLFLFLPIIPKWFRILEF